MKNPQKSRIVEIAGDFSGHSAHIRDRLAIFDSEMLISGRIGDQTIA